MENFNQNHCQIQLFILTYQKDNTDHSFFSNLNFSQVVLFTSMSIDVCVYSLSWNEKK